MLIRPLMLFIFASVILCSRAVQAGDGSAKAGDLLAAGLPLVAAGLSLERDDLTGLWQLLKAEGTTVVLTQGLKVATHETRPNGRDDKSFPSLHASVAFAAAQYLQVRDGWTYGLPAYLAAGLVAYSRVHAHEHSTKDVVAGALLGASASTYFTERLPRTGIAVVFGPGSAAVQVQQRW